MGPMALQTVGACHPETEMPEQPARLLFVRQSDRDIKMRGLEVLVDGEMVTDLQYGKTYQATVTPGPHEVKVTNSLYTQKLDVELKPGETIRFETGNIATGLTGVMMSTIGIGPYKVFLRRI